MWIRLMTFKIARGGLTKAFDVQQHRISACDIYLRLGDDAWLIENRPEHVHELV